MDNVEKANKYVKFELNKLFTPTIIASILAIVFLVLAIYFHIIFFLSHVICLVLIIYFISRLFHRVSYYRTLLKILDRNDPLKYLSEMQRTLQENDSKGTHDRDKISRMDAFAGDINKAGYFDDQQIRNEKKVLDCVCNILKE